MIAYSCIVVAAVAMVPAPGPAFAPKGLRSPKGLACLLGHATAAAAPGMLWAAADPQALLAAHGVSIALAVAAAAYLTLTRVRIVSVPAASGSRPAPSGDMAAAPPIDPFTLARASAAPQA